MCPNSLHNALPFTQPSQHFSLSQQPPFAPLRLWELTCGCFVAYSTPPACVIAHLMHRLRAARNANHVTHRITRLHTISHDLARFHTTSHDLTRFYTISHDLARSRTISHDRTYTGGRSPSGGTRRTWDTNQAPWTAQRVCLRRDSRWHTSTSWRPMRSEEHTESGGMQ